ncbi:flagellar export chaperone FlgN [Janthinobacterium agaricidamnosum]|uniref:FlgN family protein n=1 Tax=Janthinobacterium agaricidamnosum NBRC 102515 = DSM 9628 TaxID=1349767 RepID=W0V3U8_9BURK|nr:flagellar export chaperone FlgN [Janthinobacterium agaricidamnosum]CDG82551.1 putative uncharacterized protein [Janthinobacterium agaricidamnosum NBRC 102515 = DSM 9628]
MSGAAKMTRPQALTRVLRGVSDDIAAYGALLELQEQQFQAALRHQPARLSALAESINAAVDGMEQRRRQRVSLVRGLSGAGGTMNQIIELLQGAPRLQLETDWAALEQMVLECKRLNQRNSHLLTEQYSIMQRVLHGEDDTYAPG